MEPNNAAVSPRVRNRQPWLDARVRAPLCRTASADVVTELPPTTGADCAPATGSRDRHPAPVQAGTSGSMPGQSRLAMAVAGVRRHWLAVALLAAGLALRVLALIAYRPALIYVDTLKYLYGEWPGSDPLGYTVVLKPLARVGSLTAVAAVQHLLGLAMAACLYAVLLRRGVSRWLAAMAIAPVLLDAYQLHMEQMIMPDVWFEAMIVAALAVLLWRTAVTVPFAITAGLLLGLSATFRQLGEVLAVPAVLYLLAAGDGWRARVRASATLALVFLVPILAYCAVSDIRTGHFWLAGNQPDTGRLMAAADCAALKVRPAARLLCPTPAEQARGPDWLEHSHASPLLAFPLPSGTRRGRLIGALDAAVIRQQPLRVVAAIARDSLRLYALTRSRSGGTPIVRWQFQTSYPVSGSTVSLGPGNVIIVGLRRVAFGRVHLHRLNPAYGGRAQVDRPVAAFLRSYQLSGGYTPGPLLGLFTLTGLAGSVLALTGRRRPSAGRGPSAACLLFTVTAAAVLLLPDFYEFSWRYQLPAVITLPPAGVLGITALLSYGRARRVVH